MKSSKKAIFGLLAISLTLVGLLLVSVVFGYRYFTVISPSMSETAPVGSLVITEKTDKVNVGDIVSYYRGSRVYTHRIVGVENGDFITKGDLNEVNDSVPLKRGEIIGKSIFIAKYLGWIWSALPFFLIGLLIVYLISCWKRIADEWRWPLRIVGYALVVIITTFIINPWMRVEALNYKVVDKGVDITMVNTGVFPLSDEQGGRFFAGQVKTVNTQQLDEKGRFIYVPRPSLGFWGVVFVVVWCLAPMFMAMIVKIPATEEFENLSSELAREEKNRNLIIFIATLIISILITAFQVSSLAGFTATVVNNQTFAKNNEYFTCSSAHSDISNPKPFLAYSLEKPDGNDDDISGNGRTGRRTGAFTQSDSTGACVRDKNNAALNFSNSNRNCVAFPQIIDNPDTFSLEIWFRTTVKNNSKMIGFGANRNGTGQFVESGLNYSDRHVYIHDGVIHFGLYPGKVVLLRSPQGKNYADGKWHHLIVTTSPTDGTKMYVNGALVASNNSGGGENYRGFWKIGCGRMIGWRGADNSVYHGGNYYDGDLRQVAIYDLVLNDNQVLTRYLAGAAPSN